MMQRTSFVGSVLYTIICGDQGSAKIIIYDERQRRTNNNNNNNKNKDNNKYKKEKGKEMQNMTIVSLSVRHIGGEMEVSSPPNSTMRLILLRKSTRPHDSLV